METFNRTHKIDPTMSSIIFRLYNALFAEMPFPENCGNRKLDYQPVLNWMRLQLPILKKISSYSSQFTPVNIQYLQYEFKREYEQDRQFYGLQSVRPLSPTDMTILASTYRFLLLIDTAGQQAITATTGTSYNNLATNDQIAQSQILATIITYLFNVYDEVKRER